MTVGRFAPSPTGELHLGNLRTALAAWASAVSAGGEFLIRWEDLDQHNSSLTHARTQLADLAALGIIPAREPVTQSERFHLYHAVIDGLIERGLTYECFCSRKDIREAAAAPHGGSATYPGTCRGLTEAERAERRKARPGAVRLSAGAVRHTFVDVVHGEVTGVADDIVLRRNDGVPAYNLAVVVDDAEQGVTEIVRGEDLLDVTASQVHLYKLLGHNVPTYAHVPLVIGGDGERLAKRHGAVTLRDLAERGVDADTVRDVLWRSLGQSGDTWEWDAVPRSTWEWTGT